MQKITIVTFIDYRSIVKNLNQAFSFLNVLSFLTEDIFSNDCFLQEFINDLNTIYLYKTIIIIIIPFLFSFICYSTYLLFNFRSKSRISNKITIIFFLSIFLFYPLITKCSLSLLNCMSLNESGLEFLYVSPNIQCWTGFHLTFFIIIGLFGIGLWGVGFPMMLCFFIKKKISSENKKKFIKFEVSDNITYRTKNKSSETEKNIINIKVIESIKGNVEYKFFYKDYTNNFFYWESLIFAQKFGISLFQNTAKIIGQEKSDLMFIFVLFIYFFILLKYQPFKIKQMNILESTSITISIVTKVFFVISRSYQDNYVFAVVLYGFIFSFNIIFFLIAIYFFIKLTKWKRIIQNATIKYNNLKRRISSTLNPNFSLRVNAAKIVIK